MWRIVRSGDVGAIKAMNVISFTDWMLRPRMPEEVDVERGGGVAFRQAPHQIDSLRFLGGGLFGGGLLSGGFLGGGFFGGGFPGRSSRGGRRFGRRLGSGLVVAAR